ncbi:pleckstrin homology domain-containing family S member 1 isoform X2 [Dromaius novaehollandiae]|uniref:pleckstrin homology domain-containing family S member 1 isoform X2 n=1 Tax=Dromaius novaehollandiae TaxID=8790 RepID=UPI000E1F9E65|nr:pleckstrin homology domain-containing family S member 1 isoform X1 [Dromaius novaehollandiae]XP_025973226.1 pleckstrin homology domain-containing family S member 1 isoform X1 [Dromaius novaehollandiae]XP_025973227.1 pleckstrin homology domain-containing family S member 1 isoform X1 [Dromaius novaehollandiae]
MASRNRRNSAGDQIAFCPKDEVCKHGFFTKSPPLQLLSSQNSWKRRFFILSKSSKGYYTLKYLKGQNIKGSIAVDQIINTEIGISNSERMATVRKMFKCPPEEVMSISTGDRTYYLIGRNRQEIEDWVTEISSICREVKEGGCPQNQDLANPEVKSLPSSLPLSMNDVAMTSHLERQNIQKEKGPSEEKNRPKSDPGPHQSQYDSLRRDFPSLNKNMEKTEENPLLSDTDEDIKEEEDDYYKTPSSLLTKCNTEISKPDPTAESNVPVQEKPVQKNTVKENIYMSMKSLRVLDENHQLMCTSDRLLTPPKCQETSACPRDLMANRDLKLAESSTRQQPTLQRKQNSLPLSVVQLTILLSQVTDKTQLQKLDIFIPLTDINSNLTLTEAAGKICVSHWTGPYQLGCIFNHGDHIVAVNDLHPKNMEEVSLFISRSTRKEVKLTICRIPDSDIFHVKGCSCS